MMQDLQAVVSWMVDAWNRRYGYVGRHRAVPA